MIKAYTWALVAFFAGLVLYHFELLMPALYILGLLVFVALFLGFVVGDWWQRLQNWDWKKKK